MLLELHIAGIGVIEDLDLEFHQGLNVLTGETGAGKTMVTVGLTLALGGRASAVLVRRGSKRARVEARFFAPPSPGVGEWAEDGEVVLARTVSEEGKSAARIGGQIVPVSALASIAPELVELHGQNQVQRLLEPGAQTGFLDRFAGPEHVAVAEEYRQAYERLRRVRLRLDELDREARDREREKDLLAYQVREIESAGVHPGELAGIESETARLAHSERLLERARTAEDALGSDGSAADRLHEAASALRDAAAVDPGAAGAAERATQLAQEASDLARDVRDYREELRADPARLEELQERLHALRSLERKYGEGEDGILAYLEQSQARLSSLAGADDERAGLEAEATDIDRTARGLADRLSAGRADAAPRLAEALEAELHELGMQGASVRVTLESQQEELGPSGRERAQLLFSGGPGQAPLPLSKVASGGELSRTMLACRSVMADLDAVPTLVFDEVDAGIGGRAGLAVGRRLARLARTRQVLVVTHLPQIACFADRHVRVRKREGTATVSVLDQTERVAEISRMLSGLPESDAAVSHAEELLAEAERERDVGARSPPAGRR
ncbi:MAG: DNA repair protein RecN [Actinomycetota bacterium]|nr:DNA repair protein RecN [Actinomycetota bacterium]